VVEGKQAGMLEEVVTVNLVLRWKWKPCWLGSIGRDTSHRRSLPGA
jgi:hypothetical protein